MTVADIILVTIAATLGAAGIVYMVVVLVTHVWKFAHDLIKDIRVLISALIGATQAMTAMRDELAYQRQMVTAANPALAEQMERGEAPPQPPVGTASTMPGGFPQRPWESYPQAPIPEATREDTDMSVIEQTDEELMVAQDREEKIAKGIEPDDDYGPRPAVREEA